jgi:hypothetical protein
MKLSDEVLSAYLDNELSVDQRSAVELRLKSDSVARARLEEMGAVDVALRQSLPAETSRVDRLIAVTQTQRRSLAPQVFAIAAAAVFGLFLGRFAMSDSSDAFAINREQALVLETRVSGERVSTRDGAVEVVLTLQSDAGDLCRQFRVSPENVDVLACRNGEAGWIMVAAQPAPTESAYIPAGGASPIDAAMDRLGPAEALDAERERALISNEWR